MSPPALDFYSMSKTLMYRRFLDGDTPHAPLQIKPFDIFLSFSHFIYLSIKVAY